MQGANEELHVIGLDGSKFALIAPNNALAGNPSHLAGNKVANMVAVGDYLYFSSQGSQGRAIYRANRSGIELVVAADASGYSQFQPYITGARDNNLILSGKAMRTHITLGL